MVSYDEEDEDSDLFGESDRDNEEDDEDNTEVRPHLTLYLLRKPKIILILMDFTSQIQNTGPSSFAEELAARIKGDVVIKAEGDRACKLLTLRINMPFPSLLSVILVCSLSLCHPCVLIIFVFLPSMSCLGSISIQEEEQRQERVTAFKTARYRLHS